MYVQTTLFGRFVSCALALLLPGVWAATMQAQTFSPPLQLTGTGMEPKIAVDANGNINVVWRDEPNSNVQFTRSTDGGATFSTPVQISRIPAGGSPSPFPLQIAVDSGGAIHILAEGTLPPAAGRAATDELFYARSTDGGATFSVTPITNGQGFIVYAPVIALGPSGSINILWMSLSNPKLSVSRSTDGGATFLTTTVWNWPGVGKASGVPQLVVDATENVYVAWDYCSGSMATCNLLFSRSTDQGKTYSTATILGGGADPALAFGQSGNLDLAWSSSGLLFSRSIDRGATFSAPTMISQGGNPNAPQMAVDSKGDIFVIWDQPSSTLHFSRSMDGGSTFSPAQTLGNLVGIPQIAVDSSGNIDIAAGGTASNGSSQILLVRSTDAGTVFSGPAQVSDDTERLCPTFSEMALERGGDIDVIWEEFPTPFGSTGVPGCDSIPNQVLFSRGVVTQPDFTISATPGTQNLLPGGAAKFSVTLTATAGFSDAVNLSCANLPPGVACTFDSSLIVPKDSGSQTTLTVTTPPTLAQGNYSITITATSVATKHTQSTQIVLGGLSGSIAPTSATIAVGTSATFAVSVTSADGFSGLVNLACSGVASELSCKFDPSQVSVAATGSGNSTLTVNVSSKPSISLNAPHVQNPSVPLPRSLPSISIGLVVFVAALLAFVILPTEVKRLSSTRRWNPGRFFGGGLPLTRLLRNPSATGRAALALMLVLAVILVSCGGATSGAGTVGSGGAVSGSGGGGTGGTGGSNSVTVQFAVQAQSGGVKVNLGIVSITVP